MQKIVLWTTILDVGQPERLVNGYAGLELGHGLTKLFSIGGNGRLRLTAHSPMAMATDAILVGFQLLISH